VRILVALRCGCVSCSWLRRSYQVLGFLGVTYLYVRRNVRVKVAACSNLGAHSPQPPNPLGGSRYHYLLLKELERIVP
jgi:hypothetical protein